MVSANKVDYLYAENLCKCIVFFMSITTGHIFIYWKFLLNEYKQNEELCVESIFDNPDTLYYAMSSLIC